MSLINLSISLHGIIFYHYAKSLSHLLFGFFVANHVLLFAASFSCVFLSWILLFSLGISASLNNNKQNSDTI